jgi:hypothetical protein
MSDILVPLQGQLQPNDWLFGGEWLSRDHEEAAAV